MNQASVAGANPGPVRSCVVCRARAAQTELVRLAHSEGVAVVSRTAPGRGAWVHPACLGRLTLKTVSRALRTTIGQLPDGAGVTVTG